MPPAFNPSRTRQVANSCSGSHPFASDFTPSLASHYTASPSFPTLPLFLLLSFTFLFAEDCRTFAFQVRLDSSPPPQLTSHYPLQRKLSLPARTNTNRLDAIPTHDSNTTPTCATDTTPTRFQYDINTIPARHHATASRPAKRMAHPSLLARESFAFARASHYRHRTRSAHRCELHSRYRSRMSYAHVHMYVQM